MTRDETVALFLECEAKRRDARAAALVEGKSGDDANAAAHEAAKAHWNAWAEPLLAERKAMEADGRWAAEKQHWGSLKPKNAETGDWMKKATADFSRCLFLVRGAEGTKDTAGEEKENKDGAPPVKSIELEGDSADFSSFIFPGDAHFASAAFSGNAYFGSAAFSGDANFKSAAFSGFAGFKSAAFSGFANFESAAFSGYAHLESAAFSGYAHFESAAFSGTAHFGSAAFSGDAHFGSAAFSGTANFASAAFSGNAYFESAAFSGYADFASAAFSGDADFTRAAFSGDARFASAAFSGPAIFESAAFSGDAGFASAAFSGLAIFGSAAFSGDANFANAAFSSDAFFASAAFSGPAIFGSAAFSGTAIFTSATFKRNAFFTKTAFKLAADFYAIRGERGFDMAGATFEAVPDFIQAHFEEAPRLDNLKVLGHTPFVPPAEPEEGEKLSRRVRVHRRLAKNSPGYRRIAAADRDIPSRWRALKRLAIQGNDSERELEFHAREMQSQRFAEHWPVPWLGFFPFVSGYLYEIFSNFGRSLIRPAIFWGLAVAIGAAFYLSQTDAMRQELALQEAPYLSATVQTAHYALSHTVPCYSPPTLAENSRNQWFWWRRAAKIDPNASRIGGLIEPFHSQTGARAEALHLAFRNAFVLLDGSNEAAHRTYGCLYGVELYGGSNPLAIVPGAVSTVSAGQKLFSALMIFLFGLALRNMLKMK